MIQVSRMIQTARDGTARRTKRRQPVFCCNMHVLFMCAHQVHNSVLNVYKYLQQYRDTCTALHYIYVQEAVLVLLREYSIIVAVALF